MKIPTFCIVAAAPFLAVLTAQEPVDPTTNQKAPEAKLHSLQLLLTETIFARQPLAGGERHDETLKNGAPKGGGHRTDQGGGQGTTGDRPFAIVRDATFDPSGRLTALIVESPSGDAGRGVPSRVLPARSVQWDEATKRWLVSELSLQWAELAEWKRPTADSRGVDTNRGIENRDVEGRENQNQPVDTSLTARPIVASELLNARISGLENGNDVRREGADTLGGVKQRVVWWMSPVHEQLAFAVVGHGDRFLALPWPLLRTSGQGAQTEVRVVADATATENAPVVPSAMEPPVIAVRQAAYRHYGVEVPQWDAEMPRVAQRDERTARTDPENRERRQGDR